MVTWPLWGIVLVYLGGYVSGALTEHVAERRAARQRAARLDRGPDGDR